MKRDSLSFLSLSWLQGDQSTQLDSDDWGSVSDEEDEEEVMDWLTSPTLV